MKSFTHKEHTVTLRPLSDRDRQLLFASVERFQKNQSTIEANTASYIAIARGLESISNFDLQFDPKTNMVTWDSLQSVLQSFDQDFLRRLIEEVWFANISFGKPADLKPVSRMDQ